MAACAPRVSQVATALVVLIAQLSVGVQAARNSSDHGGRKLAARKPARPRSRAHFRSSHRSRSAQADTGAAAANVHHQGRKSAKQGEDQTPMRRPEKGRPYHHAHKKASLQRRKPPTQLKQPIFDQTFHVDMRTYTPSTPEEKEEDNQIWARFRADQKAQRQTGASCLDYQDYLVRLNEECVALSKINDDIQETMMNDLMKMPINEPVKLLPAANLIDFSTGLYGKCVQEKDKYLDGMRESCMGEQEKLAQDSFLEIRASHSL